MAQHIAASQTLKGVAVFEKDVNGDVLTWSFPSVDKVLEGVLKSRSGLLDNGGAGNSAPSSTLTTAILASITDAPFRFTRFGNQWCYQFTSVVDAVVAKTKKVLAVNIAVLSNTYNPAKYQDLCKLFLKAYLDSDLSPIPIMQLYLEILTTNKTTSSKFGAFDDSTYDNRKAMISPLKYLVNTLGNESILIWMAMLLKKRVVVYHPKLNEVQNLVKIFPLLGAWHRQDFSLLRPYVNVENSVEVEELKRAGVYVAGVIDQSIASRKDLYDVFIDIPAKTCSFSSGKESSDSNSANSASAVAGQSDERPADFHLTKFHRTTLESFVQAAQNENDQGVIKVVAQQTKDFLDKLIALRSEDASGVITREGLAAAGLPPAMQNWIYSVASAEGMTKK